MIVKINGEQPFQILADNFSISPSESSYVLQVSADGKEYSDLFSVGAGITRMITGVAAGSFYRLKNNTSEVSVNWRKSCGGGSEGGATELKPMESLPMTADEGAVAATVEGVFQFNDGTWNPIGGSDEELAQRVDEIEETTSIALNDLNDRVVDLEEGGGSGGETPTYIFWDTVRGISAEGFWRAVDEYGDTHLRYLLYIQGNYSSPIQWNINDDERTAMFTFTTGNEMTMIMVDGDENVMSANAPLIMSYLEGGTYEPVGSVVAVSQEDYDAMVEEGSVDGSTLYIIR